MFTNTAGLPDFQPDSSSPSMGRINRSQPVVGFASSNARNLPLGCHEPGRCWLLLSVSRCTFDVPAGAHQIAIYAPGTNPEDINTAVLTALCPGPTRRLINDPTNRVALITHACGSAWQAQYTFNTPGRYLVICAFPPHFNVGMYGWVEVRDRR